MSYKVAIRENETGEIHMYHVDDKWYSHSHYLWTDGNYSCDCNRASFFYDEDGDYPCGETLFTALYAEMEDGSRIELDEEAG